LGFQDQNFQSYIFLLLDNTTIYIFFQVIFAIFY